jgi:predicted DNA binding CopG/RHH family protein
MVRKYFLRRSIRQESYTRNFMSKMNKMNKKTPQHKLDAEERAIERALERGEFVSVPNRRRKIERAKQVARKTISKTKAINIRISERDLVRLRAAAMREGVPYQTYVASLIHKALR